MSIRFIDAGVQPGLRTQALYHGLARAWTDGAPDTVVVTTPGDPYACIGYHQDINAEVDLEFCRERGIPVVRREVGGGAVYLDSDQLLVQWIMDPARLPLRVERRFELFVAPIIATYAEFGIEARFRPINDIHVAGRKICGTGAGRIGGAEVLVGNFLFDFDNETMARILALPSESMRQKVRESLHEYMTTMRRELDVVPDSDDVARLYREKCQAVLGREVVFDALTSTELDAVADAERKLGATEFVERPGGFERFGVKIHEDVWVAESVQATEYGEIRVTAQLHGDRLDEVSLAGEFEFAPAGMLTGLEKALGGVELDRDAVKGVIAGYYLANKLERLGVEIDDWVAAILGLKPEKCDV